jgi:hypothetical protein
VGVLVEGVIVLVKDVFCANTVRSLEFVVEAV